MPSAIWIKIVLFVHSAKNYKMIQVTCSISIFNNLHSCYKIIAMIQHFLSRIIDKKKIKYVNKYNYYGKDTFNNFLCNHSLKNSKNLKSLQKKKYFAKYIYISIRKIVLNTYTTHTYTHTYTHIYFYSINENYQLHNILLTRHRLIVKDVVPSKIRKKYIIIKVSLMNSKNL